MHATTLARAMIGRPVSMPIALAPTGLAGLRYPDGEILSARTAARTAARIGVPFTLSTMSICSLEGVAAHCRAPFGFQVYGMRDRDFLYGLAAMGEAGVVSCLEILRKELDTTMAFCGQRDVRLLDDPSMLARPDSHDERR